MKKNNYKTKTKKKKLFTNFKCAQTNKKES